MREYGLEELIPFGGSKECQEANRAELAALRAVAAVAVELIDDVDHGSRDGYYFFNPLAEALEKLQEAQRP